MKLAPRYKERHIATGGGSLQHCGGNGTERLLEFFTKGSHLVIVGKLVNAAIKSKIVMVTLTAGQIHTRIRSGTENLPKVNRLPNIQIRGTMPQNLDGMSYFVTLFRDGQRCRLRHNER